MTNGATKATEPNRRKTQFRAAEWSRRRPPAGEPGRDRAAIGKPAQVVGLGDLRTVVGVVGDVRDRGPEQDWRAQAFVPLAQRTVLGATLVVRTARTALVLPAVKAAVWEEFADLPLPDAFSLDYYFDGLVAQRRVNMLLLGLFGGLSLVIAGAGLYGVMAYVVAERTKEIGIRMALGALPAAILRGVLTRALALVAGGVAVGLPVAWISAGLIESFLFEVRPHDRLVHLLVCVVLFLTAAAAAYLPARRAAHVDPIAALRAE